MLKIAALGFGLLTAVVVTLLLDIYTALLLALILGIASGAIVYRLFLNEFSPRV